MDDVIRTHDGKMVLYRRNGIWQARLHRWRMPRLVISLLDISPSKVEPIPIQTIY
jgi:hypothetical protein